MKQSFHIQWHITEICNFDCLHCYKEPFRKELGIEQLKLVADRIIEFMDKNNLELTISITGGEPFLKPEVYDIAEYVDKFDCVKEINFITNGSIIPEEKKLKFLSKLNKIYISLESVEPKINDFIRGEGSFEIVFSNLKYFCKIYNVGIMTTLMGCNIENLTSNFETFLEELFSLGVKEIVFERFIPVGKAKSLKNFVVPQEKILKFYSKIAEVLELDYEELKNFPAVKIVNNENHMVYVADCICGNNGCAVLPDGSVYPCRRFTKEVGNLVFEKMQDFYPLDKKFFKHIDLSLFKENFSCYAMTKALQNSSNS
jgi:MoaA/NifB/PqqE/SkfB family radical SAM enzyme